MPILTQIPYTEFSYVNWQVNCPTFRVRDSVPYMNPGSSQQQSGPAGKVLIVDDEKDICYLLASILRQRNIETRAANTLYEAEQMIEKEAPPVIFLDNRLPDGLAIDAVKKIKAKAPATIIVMITAHDNASDRSKALAEGVDYFIGKPFSKELIFRTIEGIV